MMGCSIVGLLTKVQISNVRKSMYIRIATCNSSGRERNCGGGLRFKFVMLWLWSEVRDRHINLSEFESFLSIINLFNTASHSSSFEFSAFLPDMLNSVVLVPKITPTCTTEIYCSFTKQTIRPLKLRAVNKL